VPAHVLRRKAQQNARPRADYFLFGQKEKRPFRRHRLSLGARHSSGAIFGWIDKDASLE
jgi:hypothetical protein